MDEAEVISELYGLPLGDFTRIRNERAMQARAAGHRELAERIRQLRKPTVSAWALNMLVRRHPEEISQLLAIGAQLRDAQSSLAGDAIRQLGRQRRQVVALLAKQARAVAAELGHRLSDAAESDIEETLQAALVDPAAAYAVRAGRLTTPLSYAGMGPLPPPGPDVVAPPEPTTPRASVTITEPGGHGALIWPVPDEVEEVDWPLDWPAPQPTGGPVFGGHPTENGRRVQEERRHGEGEARRRERDARRHGDGEARRREEEARRREEEARRREEEARRREEEARRRREEIEAARRRQELEAARRARDDAERAASDAAAALREAQVMVDAATARRAQLDQRVEELHEQLRQAEEEAIRAAKGVLDARHGRDTAARVELLARRAAERARAEVERLDH